MKKWKIFFCIMVLITLMIGCGHNGATMATVEETGKEMNNSDRKSTKVPKRNTTFTVGNPRGIHLEMWSFMGLHNSFYASMVERWNKKYPNKQIEVTFKSYDSDEVFEKLSTAFATGKEAPDMCDLEATYFLKILGNSEEQLYSLNEIMKQYEEDMLQARLDIYSKNGNYYGVPTYVGATVMYYNTKILESYGIDYTTIKTWEDYTKAGEELYAASNGEVSLTAVDTASTDWEYIGLAQHEVCWIDKATNTIDVEKDGLKKMLKMQQKWLDSGVAVVTEGGNIDCPEGIEMIISGKIASFPKPLWFMSRFINYMPQMEQVWAIAPCPVFEEGQIRSVGLGGIGTIVTQQSKNPELAAEFITYAKCSEAGAIQLWKQLGFDVCNTAIWKNESIAKDKDNRYIQYFLTNPFDILNDIEDEIRTINITDKTSVITENMCGGTLAKIFVDGEDVDMTLKNAQKELQGE